MRKAIVLFAAGAALTLMQPSPAAAGIEPSPFYQSFPNIELLRPRILNIGTVYPSLRSLSLSIDARVPTIREGAGAQWATETLRIQGLGIVNHISSILTSETPPTLDEAERIIQVADRVSLALADPNFVAPEFAPQALRAMAYASQGLGWDDQVIHPTIANAASFDILMRISAVIFAPQPEPPKVAIDGLAAMDRISAVLFAPQPEPPKALTQAFDVMDRVSSALGAAQLGAPDVAARSLDIMDRISAVAFAPQPEPPLVGQTLDIMERISAVLFAPQPEPPKVEVVQRLNIMSRIAAVLFAPQPEPPKQPYEDVTAFGTDAISVLYGVSFVTESVALDGLARGTIPGINGLSQLSKHLVAALNGGDQTKAAAQLAAMSQIARQYAGY